MTHEHDAEAHLQRACEHQKREGGSRTAALKATADKREDRREPTMELVPLERHEMEAHIERARAYAKKEGTSLTEGLRATSTPRKRRAVAGAGVTRLGQAKYYQKKRGGTLTANLREEAHLDELIRPTRLSRYEIRTSAPVTAPRSRQAVRA